MDKLPAIRHFSRLLRYILAAALAQVVSLPPVEAQTQMTTQKTTAETTPKTTPQTTPKTTAKPTPKATAKKTPKSTGKTTPAQVAAARADSIQKARVADSLRTVAHAAFVADSLRRADSLARHREEAARLRAMRKIPNEAFGVGERLVFDELWLHHGRRGIHGCHTV